MAALIIDAGVTLCIVAIKGGGGWHSGLLEDCWFVTAVTSVIAVRLSFLRLSVCLFCLSLYPPKAADLAVGDARSRTA